VSAALSNANIDTAARNVLITHQFVTGAITSESEELIVGGSENVDASLFDSFDYVALGHIHRPQNIKRETLRYCGTPLMYSISEASHTKSVTVVKMEDKGKTVVSELPLIPTRVMREIRGTYSEIMNRNNYRDTNTEDFVRIILTDEQEEPDAMAKLRVIYPYIMSLGYDNKRTRAACSFETAVSTVKRDPLELAGDFFEMQSGKPMCDEQSEYVKAVISEIWEEVTAL
jgi:exonuclease SbcD